MPSILKIVIERLPVNNCLKRVQKDILFGNFVMVADKNATPKTMARPSVIRFKSYIVILDVGTEPVTHW